MKKQQHIMASGAIREFKRHSLSDLVDTEFIRQNVSKEVMSIYKDPEHVGRKLDAMAHYTGAAILRSAFKIICDELLEGNRLNLPYGRQMFIGALPHDPLRRKKMYKNVRRILNLRTNGQVFGIRMTGARKNYYFRMPLRRRIELKDRIYKGQWYAGRI